MKILLLDDHPFARNHLKQAVEYIVPDAEIHCFENTASAALALNESKYHYVICDLQIVTGKDLKIPEYCMTEQIPYMVFSSHCNHDLISVLNRLRVNSFVNKSSPVEELHEGIRALLARKNYTCSTNQNIANTQTDDKEIPKLILTKTQSIVLSLLDKGYDQEQISEKLFITKRTVQNHLAIIRNNNGMTSTNDLLRSYRFWE